MTAHVINIPKADRYALFFRLLKQRDPDWQAEVRFAPPRRWRFDFANATTGIAIEIDGGVWTGGRHSRGGKAQIAEMEKMNAAAIQGWRVLHFEPGQVANGYALRVLTECERGNK